MVLRFIDGDMRRLTPEQADAEIQSVRAANVLDLRPYWGKRTAVIDVVCPWNNRLMASYVAALD